MTLCERCRKHISAGTKRGMERARARGVHVGRPSAQITDADLERVRSGRLTARELAKALGVHPITIRRRLKGTP